MLNTIKKIYHYYKWYIPKHTSIISFFEDYKLFNLVKTSKKYKQNVNKKKILYIPSYYQTIFPRMFDIIMVLALKIRGAEIIAVSVNDFFPKQDVIYGGIYNEQRKHKKQEYSYIENKIWKSLLKINLLDLKNYISPKELKIAHIASKKITIKNTQNFKFQGYPVGEKAAYATLNMNNMSSLNEDIYIKNQLQEHAENIIKLQFAYDKLLKKLQPDVIFSEFPHYYQWHVPFFVAKKNKINFYGAVMAEKKNSLFFANNSDSFMDPSSAWDTFKLRSLNKNQLSLVEDSINNRKARKVSHSAVYPLTNEHSELTDNFFETLDQNKPIVFFPVNVLFDLAVFKKSASFIDLPEMLSYVIDFFSKNQQYQLILKAHPAERLFYTSTYKNAAKYCLANIIKDNNLKLPANVHFLDYDSKISTFNIIPKINLGIVYTSTTTMEMAWEGKPIIAVSDNHYLGKGFTNEPKSKKHFADLIHILLKYPGTETEVNTRIKLSKIYYLLYYYHGFVNFNLITGNDTSTVPNRLLFDTLQALEPGQNEALDYICDSILNNKPIFGKNRWPPLTK